MTLAKARINNYDCNSSFIVLATVITIVNYDCKTFIVQATGVALRHHAAFWAHLLPLRYIVECKILV